MAYKHVSRLRTDPAWFAMAPAFQLELDAIVPRLTAIERKQLRNAARDAVARTGETTLNATALRNAAWGVLEGRKTR